MSILPLIQRALAGERYFLYYPSRLNLAPKLQVLIDFLKKRRGRGKNDA